MVKKSTTKLRVSLFVTIGLLFISKVSISATIENLDELIARKARYATSTWAPSFLENASNFYIWQPETLSYNDLTTDNEVMILTRAPDIEEIYSPDINTNAWSYDGSRLGFFSIKRPTSYTALGTLHTRWVLNSDGSKLKALEGYGRNSRPFDGFSWAKTELAYYTFGNHTAEGGGSQVYNLYKVELNANNQAVGKLLLDTSSINTLSKELVNDGNTTDDSRLIFRDNNTGNVRLLPTPNPINCLEIYFATPNTQKTSATLDYHWGVARHIGPSTDNWADPYGGHLSENEHYFHGVASPGPGNKGWIVGNYSGSEILTVFKDHGSYSDGGPLWADWDGSKFGVNEEIQVISNGAGTPNNPYGLPYFGHQSWDRWGRYAILGTYTDSPQPGARVFDYSTKTLLPNYPLYVAYDGQHHSWTGWTDYVVGVRPDYPVGHKDAYFIFVNKYDGNYSNSKKVVNTHYPGYTGNYNGYPRPSQSPDGTKIAFHMSWLNNNGDTYPNIAYSVAYYPYPPEIKSAVKSGVNVRLTWDFNQGTISNPNYSTPRTYTKRGWPNETTNLPPSPREIKQFRVWVSSDNSTWSPAGTVIYNNRAGRWTETSWSYETAQPPNTTQFYAVTSLEHSGLESHTLSNTWKVITDGAGNVITQVQQTPYPADPGGKSDFYKTPPKAPIYASYTHKEAPAIANGQYTIHWNAPADKTMIRYYNIYAKDGAEPFTTDLPVSDRQKFRIASIPASSDYTGTGAFKYIDWLGATDGSTKYIVSSVDYQGNETIYVAGHNPLDTVKRIPQ